MRRFKPVDEPVSFNGRVSQTALRHYARCPRSAYLYQKYRGDGSTPEMQRGSAVHAVHERAVRAMMDAGETSIPPELVKAIVNEVLADPEFHVPVEEHDYVREMGHRIGSELIIDPAAVLACETLFVLRLGDWDVRCRIDYADSVDGGASVYVADLKSAKGAPGFEEISRKRADGSLAAKSFQLILYALVLAYGVPVREEECESCSGCGWLCDWSGAAVAVCECEGRPGACAASSGCPACHRPGDVGGRGYVEIPGSDPVAARAQLFQLEFVYPGIEDREGKIVRRPVDLTRLELEEYRASLVGLLERLSNSERTGDWPAVASDQACAECPAPALCPIPSELQAYRGTINTLEQASEAAEVLYREKAEHAARQRELREWAKAHNVAVPFGMDMEMRLVYGESEVIRDKDGLWQAVMRAKDYGEEFDRSRFVKVQGRTDFRAVQLTAEEIEQRDRPDEPEMANGERWGDVPF